MTIPPMGSSNIFNMDCGPRVEVTIYETALYKIKKDQNKECHF